MAKTVGLTALAHQCGLPVLAAAGTRLPVLRRLTAAVGDEQDMLRDAVAATPPAPRRPRSA